MTEPWQELWERAGELPFEARAEILGFLFNENLTTIGDDGATNEEILAVFTRAVQFGEFKNRIVVKEAADTWHLETEEQSLDLFDEDNTYYDGFGEHWR